ncbi:MAG: succinate dehydrogenase iron-sulfur subunit [Phycisphaerales bacterium]
MVAPTANASTHADSRTVTVRIRRQDTPEGDPRWEEFRVPYGEGANVISVLQWIAAHPTTVQGKETTPVVWDSGCLEEVCGACTMVINGRVRQSCSALIANLVQESEVLTLEPMSKFPVVRDLAVDRQRMFHNLARVKAWVPIDGTWALGRGPLETPEKAEVRYKLSTCMTCGCCLEACPQFEKADDPAAWDEALQGAQVWSQVRLFNMQPIAGTLAAQRLDAVMGEGGIADCGNAQNCVKVCPKEIPLTESIAEIGRQTTIRGIKRFLGG